MALAIAILLSTLSILIEVLQFMLFARAVISWFPTLSDTAFGGFLYTVTEWVIQPVRVVFDTFFGTSNMIIDIPFFVTFFLLSIIGSII